MAVKLDTVAARDKLKPRREPYWQRLESGCFLGFRKMSPQSIGSWIARFRDAETGERPKLALGEFSELPPSERFGAAKRRAEEWFAHLGRGGAAEIVTVAKACSNYVEHIRADKGDVKAKEIESRFSRWVNDEPIARIALPKLSRTHVEAWRKKLAATPVIANPHAEAKQQRQRTRASSSVNRDMAAFRAALNYAHDLGHVTSDMAWRVALRPIEKANGRRSLYLEKEQRKALIDASPADLANFLRALSLVPLRPGALAALTVADFDARLGVLTVGKDKAGGNRRIPLPRATAEFFKTLAKDKLPGAFLLTRADGKAWAKDDWKVLIKVAAQEAQLPLETVAYTLRHSAITDLVGAGLDLLTTAQLSGTSVEMIERHYGHLRSDHAAAALSQLAL
jgi:integrase